MFRRIDTLAALGALGLHAVVAWVLVSVPVKNGRTSSRVEVEILQPPKPPEPTLTKPKLPDPPPEPEKVVPKVKNAPAPVVAPTTKPAAEPPKEPQKPVFGLPDTELTNEGDGPVIPKGNTVNADPSKLGTGPVKPLVGGNGTPGPVGPTYSPKSDVYIKTLPEIDGEACARTVSYPPEAEQLGIEGEVKLKVELDESGKVHDIKLLSGLGHGLDQAAINALRHKCHFKPAIGTDGKPAAYVIQAYTWTFELPR